MGREGESGIGYIPVCGNVLKQKDLLHMEVFLVKFFYLTVRFTCGAVADRACLGAIFVFAQITTIGAMSSPVSVQAVFYGLLFKPLNKYYTSLMRCGIYHAVQRFLLKTIQQLFVVLHITSAFNVP